jgi:hypothetical protein
LICELSELIAALKRTLAEAHLARKRIAALEALVARLRARLRNTQRKLAARKRK